VTGRIRAGGSSETEIENKNDHMGGKTNGRLSRQTFRSAVIIAIRETLRFRIRFKGGLNFLREETDQTDPEKTSKLCAV